MNPDDMKPHWLLNEGISYKEMLAHGIVRRGLELSKKEERV